MIEYFGIIWILNNKFYNMITILTWFKPFFSYHLFFHIYYLNQKYKVNQSKRRISKNKIMKNIFILLYIIKYSNINNLYF